MREHMRESCVPARGEAIVPLAIRKLGRLHQVLATVHDTVDVLRHYIRHHCALHKREIHQTLNRHLYRQCITYFASMVPRRERQYPRGSETLGQALR